MQSAFLVQNALFLIFYKKLLQRKWWAAEAGQFLNLKEAYISNLSVLIGLKPAKKFVVVVGGVWWLRVILVLSFVLSQAKQY